MEAIRYHPGFFWEDIAREQQAQHSKAYYARNADQVKAKARERRLAKKEELQAYRRASRAKSAAKRESPALVQLSCKTVDIKKPKQDSHPPSRASPSTVYQRLQHALQQLHKEQTPALDQFRATVAASRRNPPAMLALSGEIQQVAARELALQAELINARLSASVGMDQTVDFCRVQTLFREL